MNKIWKRVLTLIGVVFICGCATGGRISHTHAQLKPIVYSDNKAYVYFYRPCKVFGVLRGITVSESGDVLGGLNCNSYFILEADPGAYQFHADDWVRKEKILSLELESGQEYFIKTDLRIGIIDAVPSLTLVEGGSKDILKNLKRVPLYR